MDMEYGVVYSTRKTLALEITRDLRVLVRAPKDTKQVVISAFVEAHASWLDKNMAYMQDRLQRHPEPTPEEADAYRVQANVLLPGRIAHYSQLMGLSPTGLTITSAKTRFGSCSGKNRLSFSWRLMAYPEEAIDYVVVHELAHIRHKNHGPQFYALVANFLPDWKTRRALLR